MSGGGTRAHYARSDSNNSSFDTSSVQILLDSEIHKKSKHRKVVIGVGVSVTCFVLLLCIILLSSKSDRNVKLLWFNNTLDGSNSSSTQSISNNTTTDNKAKCQCKDLVSPSGHGNCLKGHDKTGEKRLCYVVQPSLCSDFQTSSWNGGEKYSALACTKQAKMEDTTNNVTLGQKVKDLTSKSDKILKQLSLLVDNHAESDMDQERKVKELGDKSDDILDQLKKLGENLRHTSNQISNLDSTTEAHQGEFRDMKSKVDEIHTKITSLLGNINGTQRLKIDVVEDGTFKNTSQTINTTKLELMHIEIQQLKNSLTLMQTEFGKINEKMNSIMSSKETNIHLAPSGAHKCDYGVSVDQSECEAAVRSFAESMGKITTRNMQVGGGGGCNDGSWGQVPLGCSAQSGGDWAAHYKIDTNNGDGCIHSGYQLVCKLSGHKYTYVGKGSCWNKQGTHPPYEFGTSDNSKPETCYEHCMKMATAQRKRCTGFDIRPKCVYYFDEEITRNKVSSFPGVPACFKVSEMEPSVTASRPAIVQNESSTINTNTVIFAGDGYCGNFHEINLHDTALSCFESATKHPNCNINDLVISFGKGTRSRRCLCNCVHNCKTHTHHPHETVVNPSCTLVGSSLGLNGFDSYKATTESNSIPHLLQINEIIIPHEHSSMEFGTEKAIDGNVDTFLHTSNSNNKEGVGYPWARIDLLNTSTVRRVEITNRNQCCGDRLRNLEVRVGFSEVSENKQGVITENTFCGNYDGPGTDGEVITIECTEQVEGKYVTLQLMYDPAILNIAEVAIYGAEINHTVNASGSTITETTQTVSRTDTNTTNSVRYEKTSVGFLCSQEQDEIESEEKCKHAAESLGLQWGNSWNGPNDFPACLHAEDGRDKVYYNLSPGLRTNLNPKYSAVCKAKALYQFRHRGHCAAGWDNGPNTNQTTILDCRNVCAGRANVGYFAYGLDNNCACYFSNSECPDDNLHDDHNAYRILRQDCDRPASGCSANYDIYWTGDCDGDGANDHVCSTTINNNVWVVLSSNGCGNWNKTSAADCPSAFKGGQISNGISKVGQQGRPRKKLQLTTPAATTKSMSGCSFKKFGLKLVASNEGNNVGYKYVSKLQSCKDFCNEKSDCHSFAYCPFDSSCYAKDQVLSGSEATSSHGGCTTYFRACS